MKKIVYLCVMMLFSMNMMAQIDLNDHNWETAFFDDFTQTGRYWGGDWLSKPGNIWRGYNGFSVTENAAQWFQVYQYSNNLFCPAEGKMKIVGEYCDTICYNNYSLPGWIHVFPPCDSLFYFAGEIDVYKDNNNQDLKFQYGYFEIRCKMPKHEGAHPAFWLQGASTNPQDSYYEEIDIVEFSWSASDPNATWLPAINPESSSTYLGDPRYYSTAVCQNLHGQGVDFYHDVYGVKFPHIPNWQEDISGWHTYSCEWMPDHVYFYLDGNMVNSYFDKIHIPKHHLTLKTNYGIDGYAVEHDDSSGINIYEPTWIGTDTLTIDYIKVCQLNWDCSTNEVITCQNDLNSFILYPSVKSSISIDPSNCTIIIGNTDKVTFRVSDSFEITGSFQANSGCEFTAIRQDCPD